MRRRVTVLALVLVLLGGAAGPVLAGDGERVHGERGRRFQQWLGLTEEQARDVQAVRQRHREAAKQLATALRAARADLRRLALEGTEEALIQAKEQEVAELTRQMIQLRVQALREIGPLLTPEQREKLAARPWGPPHRPDWHRQPRGGDRPHS